jgi:hypothetical protein
MHVRVEQMRIEDRRRGGRVEDGQVPLYEHFLNRAF